MGSINDIKRAASAIKKFKTIANSGAFCITEDEYDQLMKILNTSSERIDSILDRREFAKQVAKKFSYTIVRPKMKTERECISNLYQLYYYQYRLVHVDDEYL